MENKGVATWVGLFVVLATGCFLFLIFNVSSYQLSQAEQRIHISAEFSDVAGLKERSAVRIAGIKVGQVSRMTLNPNTYRALVEMEIDTSLAPIPVDSSVSVLTEGVLGYYLGISPGFELRNI